MTDVSNMGLAVGAQAMRLPAGRSTGSATPEPSVAVIPGQHPGRQVTHAMEEGQREQLKAAEPPTNLSDESAARRADRLQVAMDRFNRSVNFRIDQETGINVITIRDRNTDEIIRQYPPDEFLALAARLDEMRGLFFEEVA
jgi:flagellar protein FlaG